MPKLDKQKARDAVRAFDDGQLSALAVAGHLLAALDRVDELEGAALLCADVARSGLSSSSVAQKASVLSDVHMRLRAILEEGGIRPWMQTPRHQARLGPWTADELKMHLAAVVDGISAEKDRAASPLDVALQLLGGELEAFVLFGRAGHLDPPRPDGKVPIAILQRRSEDPVIDVKIRETAKKWAIEQEGRS
jgi:hypothetical protein